MNETRELTHDWFPQPLPTNVEVGERSWVYSSFAFLHYRSRRPFGVRIGRDSGVYIGTMFDLGPDGEVDIGDYCTLAGPTICSNRRIEVRDYALISFQVVIADSFVAGPWDEVVEPLDEVRQASSSDIVVGENAWIGSRAILLPGARIGEGAIVGAAAVVDFEVPPHAVVAGNPARVVGWRRPTSPVM